jgi:hypothetical protein
MCRKPEVRWACAQRPRLTLIRGKEGVDARGMEESGKAWPARIGTSRSKMLTVLVEVG